MTVLRGEQSMKTTAYILPLSQLLKEDENSLLEIQSVYAAQKVLTGPDCFLQCMAEWSTQD